MSESALGADASAEALPEVEADGAAAQGESGDVQAVADAADPLKAKTPADDDPEIDFGDGLKLKRSDAAKSLAKRKELDRAAFAKFEEASKIRKEWERIQQADPEEFFKARGIDPTQYAFEKLQREVEMREATPEQRAALQREQALADREMKIKEQEAQYEQRAFEAEKQQYIQKLDKELPAALQKAGLTPDPFVFAQIAKVLQSQIANDMPEDYEGAAELVAESYRENFSKHTATLKYEDAVKHYPQLVKTIREGDLARARNPQTAPQRAPVTQKPQAPKAPEQSDGKKLDDFFGDSFSAAGIRRRV